MKRLLLALLFIPTICFAQEKPKFRPLGINYYLMSESYDTENWEINTKYSAVNTETSSQVLSGMVNWNIIALWQKINDKDFLNGQHRLCFRYLRTSEISDSVQVHIEDVVGMSLGIDPIVKQVFNIQLPFMIDIGVKDVDQKDVFSSGTFSRRGKAITLQISGRL